MQGEPANPDLHAEALVTGVGAINIGVAIAQVMPLQGNTESIAEHISRNLCHSSGRFHPAQSLVWQRRGMAGRQAGIE